MTAGRIRTVLGDIEGFDGVAYAHEHLVLDSPLIADRFPHILLDDVDAAVAEVAAASVATGAPVLTHCEGGRGGIAQVELLVAAGVPAPSIIVSHVDKAQDLAYLHDLAETGAILELDQSLRELSHGTSSITVRAVLALVSSGFVNQIVLGTDGARRSLWNAFGGSPGLAWLARDLPAVLTEVGLGDDALHKVFHANAARALAWR